MNFNDFMSSSFFDQVLSARWVAVLPTAAACFNRPCACSTEPVKNTDPATAERVVLHQFRPAWDVQALLRFTKTPHHIQNSRYRSFTAGGTSVPAIASLYSCCIVPSPVLRPRPSSVGLLPDCLWCDIPSCTGNLPVLHDGDFVLPSDCILTHIASDKVN